MFYFGTPEDIAHTYITAAVASSWKFVPDQPLEDMNPEQITDCCIHYRMAIMNAIQDGASKEVKDILYEVHDELLSYAFMVDRRVADAYKAGKWNMIEPSIAAEKRYAKMFRDYAPAYYFS